MPTHYVKTAAGLAEIQARAANLSRPVRNLLLVINESQPVDYWLSQVRGVSDMDLASLREARFIEERRSGSAGARSAPQVAPQAAPRPTAVESGFEAAETPEPSAFDEGSESGWAQLLRTVSETGYERLYDVLTSQGKARLGLMRGYRFALEVEHCSGPAELHALARRFLEQLREDQGMAAVRSFHEALRHS